MSMTQASSSYFEQVARQWDTLRSGYFTEAVRTAAIEKAYLRPEMVVADIGAGTGFISAGLAPLVQKVIAIDGSPAMLEVARKNLAPFNNVEYQVGEGLAIPLPDGSVDAAFANMYLHHCPDPLAAIAEMVRIIKPGGRLVITDMDTHPYAWLKDEMADEWMGFERDQVRAWFKAVDLVNVIVDCTGESCCAESRNPELKDAQGRSASISIFVATGTRRLRMQSAVKEAYSAAAQSKPLAEGCGCGTPTKARQAVEGAKTGAASQSTCSCGDPGEAQPSVAKSACCAGEGSEAAAASTACCTGEPDRPPSRIMPLPSATLRKSEQPCRRRLKRSHLAAATRLLWRDCARVRSSWILAAAAGWTPSWQPSGLVCKVGSLAWI